MYYFSGKKIPQNLKCQQSIPDACNQHFKLPLRQNKRSIGKSNKNSEVHYIVIIIWGRNTAFYRTKEAVLFCLGYSCHNIMEPAWDNIGVNHIKYIRDQNHQVP